MKSLRFLCVFTLLLINGTIAAEEPTGNTTGKEYIQSGQLRKDAQALWNSLYNSIFHGSYNNQASDTTTTAPVTTPTSAATTPATVATAVMVKSFAVERDAVSKLATIADIRKEITTLQTELEKEENKAAEKDFDYFDALTQRIEHLNAQIEVIENAENATITKQAEEAKIAKNSALSTAETTKTSALATAEKTRDNALATAETAKNNALAKLKTDYEAECKKHSKTKQTLQADDTDGLDTELNKFKLIKLQYESDSKNTNTTYNTSTKVANTTYDAAVKATNTSFSTAIEEAKRAYIHKLGNPYGTASTDLDKEIKAAETAFTTPNNTATFAEGTFNALRNKIGADAQRAKTDLTTLAKAHGTTFSQALSSTQEAYNNFLQKRKDEAAALFPTATEFVHNGESHSTATNPNSFMTRFSELRLGHDGKTGYKFSANEAEMESVGCVLPDGSINPEFRNHALIDPITGKKLGFDKVAMIVKALQDKKIADGTVIAFDDEECVKNGSTLRCRTIKSDLQAAIDANTPKRNGKKAALASTDITLTPTEGGKQSK